MSYDAITALERLVCGAIHLRQASKRASTVAAIEAAGAFDRCVLAAMDCEVERFLIALRAAIGASSPTIDGDTLDQVNQARFIPAAEWEALVEALGTSVPPDPSDPRFHRAAKEGF